MEESFSCSWGHENLWNVREVEKLTVEYNGVQLEVRHIEDPPYDDDPCRADLAAELEELCMGRSWPHPCSRRSSTSLRIQRHHTYWATLKVTSIFRTTTHYV